MANDGDESVSEQEKLRIAANFIRHSPPGELNEILSDIRMLLNNEDLMKEDLFMAIAHYNKENLTPVNVGVSNNKTLISDHNDLGGSRFFDDNCQVSFKFDHIKRQASEFQSWTPDPIIEEWRSAIDHELSMYTMNHYENGICSVFGKKSQMGNMVVMCIEDHQFQPNNFWNGSWCSQWNVSFLQNSASVDIQGILKIKVHYYEDGNVQLDSSKEVKKSLPIASAKDLAKSIIQLIKSEESDYQNAVSSNYQMMSENTFKALRRQLPVTHAKIDWNKIVSYSIGKIISGK